MSPALAGRFFTTEPPRKPHLSRILRTGRGWSSHLELMVVEVRTAGEPHTGIERQTKSMNKNHNSLTPDFRISDDLLTCSPRTLIMSLVFLLK